MHSSRLKMLRHLAAVGLLALEWLTSQRPGALPPLNGPPLGRQLGSAGLRVLVLAQSLATYETTSRERLLALDSGRGHLLYQS